MPPDQIIPQNSELSFDHFLADSPLKVSSKALGGDKPIHIDASRNTLIAIVFSLLLHGVILFFVPRIQFDTPASSPPTTIEVSLSSPKPVTNVIEPKQEVVQEKPSESAVKPKNIVQKPNKIAKPVFMAPDVRTTTQPAYERLPTKEPVVKESPAEERYVDMASYVKAMQAQKQSLEFDAAKQNAEAAARERGPTEAEMREERIKRNFQNGTNGIFEITSLGSRSATFSFRGWTSDYSASKRQFFEVEASGGEDVRRVMIKRMIALIREHYQGDFNWESRRLGRSVPQSARPEDNAGLEDFMMMEFFGTKYKNSP